MPSDIRLFQIYYNPETEAALDPAFEPLDNTRNERPDWFEYWPIRQWLADNKLDDDTYYGFFSPKFGVKTRLSGAKVRAFVQAQSGADIVTFSPTPELACIFSSVFDQGENFHPGLMAVSQAFFQQLGIQADLRQLVTDVRTTVFCNYFVAKGSFWRRWQGIFEACFAQAEDAHSPLHERLCARAEYYNPAQQKIFLMERVPSLLMATDPGIKTANYAPFDLPVSHSVWLKLFDNLVVLDAAKFAYRQTGEAIYLKTFHSLLKAVNDSYWKLYRPT